MNESMDNLEAYALTLNEKDRIELASRLLSSVEQPSDDLEAAWEKEIVNRIERFDSGEAESIPAAEVFEGLANHVRSAS